MKTKFIISALALTTALFFSSCDDNDEVAKPVITILELGEDDSRTANVGDELHVEIDVLAEGTIDIIQLMIHPEGEHDEEEGHEEWELDTLYTKFEGLKNTSFHEHIDIDSLAEAGEYHFDFIVTDMEGNQSSAEADLIITNN